MSRLSTPWSLLVLPLALALGACDGDGAGPGPISSTPPANICDDLPYAWATDAVLEQDLASQMSGRIAVTMKDWNGSCTITRPGQRNDFLLTISTERTTAYDAKILGERISQALKENRGTSIQTTKGVGVVINEPSSMDAGRYTSVWVCEGTKLQVSLRNARDPATATARLRLLTERLVGLLTCHPPIAT